MLTGFNTDIKHNGVIYHVQTEDKGPENPLILSLVYVGGEILAAKRTIYAKDLADGISEADLQEKLEKQHKLILAVINRGRIDDLVKMREREIAAERAAKESVVQEEPPALPPPATLPPPIESVPEVVPPRPALERPGGLTELLSPLLPQSPPPPPPPPRPEPIQGMTQLLSPLLGPDMPPPSAPPPPRPETLSGVTQMLSPLLPTPSQGAPPPPGSSGALDALLQKMVSSEHMRPPLSGPLDPGAMQPEPIRPGAPSGTTGGLKDRMFREFDLDRIISDYLQTESKEEKPEIRLLGNTNFFAGETVVLQIEVSRGQARQPMSSTPVLIKILGTSFKPQTHSMLTGPDGIAMTTITLPSFTAGSAAIVVQTSSEAGEAEIKHLIRRR